MMKYFRTRMLLPQFTTLRRPIPKRRCTGNTPKRAICGSLPRPCYKVYKDTVAEVPNAAARDALHASPALATTTGYWTGNIGGSSVDLFYGNYLNYLACTTCSILEAKIVIAKRVVGNIINNTNGVRFGVMKFSNNGTQGNGGGGMVGHHRNREVDNDHRH